MMQTMYLLLFKLLNELRKGVKCEAMPNLYSKVSRRNSLQYLAYNEKVSNFKWDEVCIT